MGYLSTLTSKGQTTIPKQIRQALRLKPGDRIDFSLGDDGVVRLRPVVHDVRSLKGRLGAYVQTTIPLEEMKEAVKKRFQQR